MQEHLGQPERTGNATGQLTGSAAVGHQDTTTNVVTAGQRNLLDGGGHRLNRKIQSPLRQLLRSRTKALNQTRELPLHHAGIGTLLATDAEHGREPLHLQTPEQQVGVGDRQRPTPSITGRSWIGTSGTGPHGEPVTITADDRTATRGHSVDRQPWGKQLQASDPGVRRTLPLTVRGTGGHTEDIRAGAAHVEPHQRLPFEASLSGHSDRTDHPSGGPRQNRVLGLQPITGLQRTTGGHHPETGAVAEVLPHLIEIGEERACNRRLHQCGLPAGHKPGQRTDPMGAHHGGEAMRTDKGLEALFMAWVTPGMQQRNRATAQALTVVLAQTGSKAIIKKERLQFLAVRPHAPLHLLHR